MSGTSCSGGGGRLTLVASFVSGVKPRHWPPRCCSSCLDLSEVKDTASKGEEEVVGRKRKLEKMPRVPQQLTPPLPPHCDDGEASTGCKRTVPWTCEAG